MPPTTETIAERPAFDVFGAILVLSFLATLGAALLMRQELVEHWGYGLDKTSAEFRDKAVHITEMNKDPKKYEDYVQVTDMDLKEWEFIKGKGTPFPVTNYKWPEGYDPLENPVKPGANNLEAIPEVQRSALMKDWTPAGEGPAPAPAPAPAEKKEEAKKEDTKTEPAPAPAPAPAEKKEEAKKEDTKTEAAPAPAPVPAPPEKKEEAKKDEAKKE